MDYHNDRYRCILNSCRDNDIRSARKLIDSLIKHTNRTGKAPQELMQLYSLCRLYTMTNRIDEIKNIFLRLLKADEQREVYFSRCYNKKRLPDIEIEYIDSESVQLVSWDSEIADIMNKVQYKNLGLSKVQTAENKCWKTQVSKLTLPLVIGQLKMPEYLSFLTSAYSHQFVLDF